MFQTDKAVQNYIDPNEMDTEWNEYQLDARERLIGYQAIVNSADVLVGLRFITKYSSWL